MKNNNLDDCTHVAPKEEFCLSDKRKQHDDITCDQYYEEEDVKKFIRLLKKSLKHRGHGLCVSDTLIDEEIDKLSGDKLI